MLVSVRAPKRSFAKFRVVTPGQFTVDCRSTNEPSEQTEATQDAVVCFIIDSFPQCWKMAFPIILSGIVVFLNLKLDTTGPHISTIGYEF